MILRVDNQSIPNRSRQVYDLEQIIQDVIWIYDSQAKEKAIELNLEIVGPIPKRFPGDELRLKQILSNLTSNALKFTNSGVVKLFVQRPNPDHLPEYLMFSVCDTGCGINENEVDTIFDPFTQLQVTQPC